MPSEHSSSNSSPRQSVSSLRSAFRSKPTMTSTTVPSTLDVLPPYRLPTHKPDDYTIHPSPDEPTILIRHQTGPAYTVTCYATADPPLLLRRHQPPVPTTTAAPVPYPPPLAALRYDRYPDGALCLGPPTVALPALPRWTPWTRTAAFKTFSFSVPAPDGSSVGARRLRWERSRSRKHGLGGGLAAIMPGRATKGWLLRNLDTDEVVASLRLEGGDVLGDREVGEVKWWSDVTADEEVGALMCAVGIWYRMGQLENEAGD